MSLPARSALPDHDRGRSTVPGGGRGTLVAMPDAGELDLHALGAAARQAVSAARSEAARLGHERVGTEHLLLGLLADGGGRPAQVLEGHGASAASVRTKVLEVRPRGPATDEAPDTATERAIRAIGRSVRFSHRRHNTEVTPDDLLIGVLDVEGTAGQVLRSLGLDIDDARAALDDDGRSDVARRVPASDVDTITSAQACCPRCGTDVLDDLAYHAVEAQGTAGPRSVLVFCCGSCASVLGVAPG